MRKWIIDFRATDGTFKYARVEAATAAGAIAKFMEFHAAESGGCIEDVFLDDGLKVREGFGLPTGTPPS